jgi:acetyltransferase-like isoleucine patch superfamily enzyme
MDLLRHISGPLGVRLRRIVYRSCLCRCGKGLVIDTGVSLIEPGWISVGDNVWIDKNVVIIAGPAPCQERVEVRTNGSGTVEPGRVTIGSGAHIGIGTVIQGHGGIMIGERFTTSPYCLIFSRSNDYRKCREGTRKIENEAIYYLETPVCIGNNVWLGAHVSVFGHAIGSDTFVRPGSLVISDIAPNSVADGNPATWVRYRFTPTD